MLSAASKTARTTSSRSALSMLVTTAPRHRRGSRSPFRRCRCPNGSLPGWW
jgi:hypothetical protein